MTVLALLVGGIAAVTHFRAFDFVEIVAVEASFGYALVFIHDLVANVTSQIIGSIVKVMVVAILTGNAVLLGGKVGFMVEKDVAHIGFVPKLGAW